MTETPLIDQLNELGPAGLDLLNACRRLVDQAEAELRILERQARRELLDQRVALFFAANPDARASHACDAVKGHARAEILDAARTFLAQRNAVRAYREDAA